MKKKTIRLVLSLMLGMCFQSLADDAYEENDTMETAYDFSYNEHMWLATIAGLGFVVESVPRKMKGKKG